jgi:hypothetical protein
MQINQQENGGKVQQIKITVNLLEEYVALQILLQFLDCLIYFNNLILNYSNMDLVLRLEPF